MDIRFFSFPKKRLSVIIFIALFVYGIFAFIYSEINSFHYHKFHTDKSIRNLVELPTHFKVNTTSNTTLVPVVVKHETNAKTDISLVTTRMANSYCPQLNIGGKSGRNREKIECNEHQPSESGCIFASKAYAYDAYRRNCSKERQIRICHIENGRFNCSNEACSDNKVKIHIFDNETGIVTEVASWNNSNGELAILISKYAKITIENAFKFMFLSCGEEIQLLCLNDILFEKIDENPRGQNTNININIVMFDSIARGHFYRSLHRTIDAFKTINSNHDPEATEVLDFKLFQALHGHSAENAHGLFNGSVYPITFTDSERESHPVGIKDFYKYFQSKGYRTMYQDDMCYEGIWGFRQDLGGSSTWKELYQQQKEASIDDTGLMFANCKIFEKYGANNIFNLEEENYVCYNGRQHDAYFLEYISNYFTLFNKKKDKKTISYSALNVAHDYGGLRVQAIDKDLSLFVKDMSKLDNTLTVILADHGNTYTDFVYVDLEGKYEMFHPSLFMIIPKKVRELIGVNQMNSLRSNQYKLVTMLDLHHGFKFLADMSYQNAGIFKDIPASMKCSDLPLRFPNLCVCEGWSTVVDNDTEIVGHLEFAIGKLNNIITKSSPNGMCKRLVPTLFKNVLQRKNGDHQIINFEIQTLSGNGFTSKGEKINVEITSKVSGSLSNYDMKLTSWDRVSRFGVYRECSDVSDVKFPLCVCDKGTRNTKISKLEDFYYHRTSRVYNIFGGIVKEKFDTIIEDNLVVVLRTYNERQYDDNEVEKEPYLIAITFEVINFSNVHNITYSVLVTLDGLNNIKPLTSEPCTAIVPPRTVSYMCTLYRKWNIWQAEYSYKATYTVV